MYLLKYKALNKLFGKIYLNKISLSLLPVSLAASTYNSFFIFKTILLESLAYLGQVTAEIAMIAFVILGPKSPAIAIARIIPGKDKSYEIASARIGDLTYSGLAEGWPLDDERMR